MKKIVITIITIMTTLTLAACAGNSTAAINSNSTAETAVTGISENITNVDPATQNSETIITHEVDYDSEDITPALVNSEDATFIQLNGDTVSIEGLGATAEGSLVTISAAGIYQLSGTLTDGQIIVDSEDEEDITLILAGVDITSQSSAPIYVIGAEKVILTLAAGFENVITDSDNYVNLDENSEPNAAIFSKDDLTINGEGSLTVNANDNHGIASKDDLKITGGTIIVNAVNDGIKGKDSIAILDGVITINAGADGLQSTNESDPEEGYIAIAGGDLNIIAALDGIQAATDLEISGGEINIVSGGGSVNTSSNSGGIWGGMEGNTNKPEESAKGLKAGSNLTISGGTISIDSADDSIHANANVTIESGKMQMASGDDGIHADETITINGGEINLTQSYEGMESAIITINGGTIHLVASDDGINVGGGADGSSTSGRPGQNNFAQSGNYYVTINGGTLFIDADGDGLDTNGSFSMTDGVVLVNGPTENRNGPIDYMGSFSISGGLLVAVGSSGMAQAPSTDLTQYSVIQNLTSMQPAGTMVHIETTSGEAVLTFIPTKAFQSVLISSPELQNGESYVMYIGGSSTGIAVDGLITDGEYTPGTQAASFTITSIVTGQTDGGGRR